MRKNAIKKAHITLLKSELLFIFAAVILIAFVAGFFVERAGGGAVMKQETLTPVPAVTAAAASPTAPVVSSKKVNINTASLDELKTLPEIGDTLARRIVSYREVKGGFQETEDIMNVSGIGEKTFDKIKDQITIG